MKAFQLGLWIINSRINIVKLIMKLLFSFFDFQPLVFYLGYTLIFCLSIFSKHTRKIVRLFKFKMNRGVKIWTKVLIQWHL